MDELLSINQISRSLGCSEQDAVDLLRAGYMAPYCVSGGVFFRHPENMAIYKYDEVYVKKAEVEKYIKQMHGQIIAKTSVSRRSILSSIGAMASEPAWRRREIAKMALAVYEGAAYDEPKDRYLAGVRDTLRELCQRERVWGWG